MHELLRLLRTVIRAVIMVMKNMFTDPVLLGLLGLLGVCLGSDRSVYCRYQ